MTDKDLQAREKVEHQLQSEGTRNVPLYIPDVDIYESEEALTVVADLPGVGTEGVTIDVKDNQLTIRGSISPDVSDSERLLFQEYGTGDYFRQFTLGRSIDQSRIEAGMKDGVLTLTLPKADAIKPRKINVKAF